MGTGRRSRLGAILGIASLAVACGQGDAARDDALSRDVESALEACLAAEMDDDRIDVHVVVTTDNEWVGARYTGRTDEDAEAIRTCEDQIEDHFGI